MRDVKLVGGYANPTIPTTRANANISQRDISQNLSLGLKFIQPVFPVQTTFFLYDRKGFLHSYIVKWTIKKKSNKKNPPHTPVGVSLRLYSFYFIIFSWFIFLLIIFLHLSFICLLSPFLRSWEFYEINKNVDCYREERREYSLHVSFF